MSLENALTALGAVLAVVVGYILRLLEDSVRAWKGRTKARNMALALLLRAYKRLLAFQGYSKALGDTKRKLDWLSDTLQQDIGWRKDDYFAIVKSIAAYDPVLAVNLFHKEDPFEGLYDMTSKTPSNLAQEITPEIEAMAARRLQIIRDRIQELIPCKAFLQRRRIEKFMQQLEGQQTPPK